MWDTSPMLSSGRSRLIFLREFPIAAVTYYGLDHDRKLLPAAPEGQPAGKAVALSVHVAAEASHGHVKLVDGERRMRFLRMTPSTQHLLVDGSHHVRRRPRRRVRATRRLTQVQQLH